MVDMLTEMACLLLTEATLSCLQTGLRALLGNGLGGLLKKAEMAEAIMSC
jgi:hypothetical protein